MADEYAANNNLKYNARRLAPDKRGGQANLFTRADGKAFFEPSVGVGNTPTLTPTPTTRQQQYTCTDPEVLQKEWQQVEPESFLDNLLSTGKIKVDICKQGISPSYLIKKSKSCPLPVAALVEYLLALTSFPWREETNTIMATDARSDARRG
jgi:hypothetical protein